MQTLHNLDLSLVTHYILSAPSGKYNRKIWFLYEFLLQKRLPIENIGRGPYVQLADPKMYYCPVGKRSPRHRVIDNLLGSAAFCPLVRRSSRMAQFEKQHLGVVVDKIINQYDESVLSRAMRYLYTKETIASWEIEREKPDKARLARFIALLERESRMVEPSKQMLLAIQREIVDARFYLADYRTFQNHVGEEAVPGEVYVHYIPPKPEDLPILMEGLLMCADRMLASQMHAVLAAAILAFGFVYMHPFEDGNGRLHRFLIHYTLSKLGFAPPNLVFPISAVMLREHKLYDRALESFSKPLLKLLRDYDINDDTGEMTVNQSTVDYYRFLDFTPIAEFLFWCVERTIQVDFKAELNFLTQYDFIKKSIKERLDLPDRRIDLFIKCVRQNNGTLSEHKRESYFSMLTLIEIADLESIIKSAIEGWR